MFEPRGALLSQIIVLVIIAEDPLSCVCLGTGKALDQEETFSTMFVS